MKKIKPVGDYILIKRKDSEDVTSGGIYIPENVQEKSTYGCVVGVSEKRESVILDSGKEIFKKSKFNEGDVILFNKYSGIEIENEGEKYLLIKENEIIAVIVECSNKVESKEEII